MVRPYRTQPGSDTAAAATATGRDLSSHPFSSNPIRKHPSSSAPSASSILPTAARPRTMPKFTMPAANENSQSATLMGSSLYPSSNIWSMPNSRDRAKGSRDSTDQPIGSSALNANSEADVWGQSPWNPETPARSNSTSPNRTRDPIPNLSNGATLPNGSGIFDQQRAAVALTQNGFVSNAYQDEANGFGGFTSRGLSPEAFRDSIASFAARDNVPPSRHSQGSPAYSDMYRGHTPSNSVQSQRPVPTHTSSYAHQAANQRAFNLNNQITEDLARQLTRRVTLESQASTGGSTFNPASQPFQLNPSTQPWVNDNTVSRIGGVDLSSDSLTASFQPLRRGSADRISPVPNYRVDAGNNSSRNLVPPTESWIPRPASRDPRPVETERRTPAQYPPYPYYPSQYTYPNVIPGYHPAGVDPYLQSMRAPMIPAYGLPLHPVYAGNLHIPIRPAREQDPARGVRSVLLDEFRLSSKSTKRYELKDIYQHVVEFSGDQHGSRFIQQKLETANSDEKEQVFQEIEENAIQLMKDVFGNYVIQKFFEHGNQVQKKILAEKMKGKVVDLSTQVYACRVVQKALEHVLVEQQAELTKELEPEIVKVIKDQNGNHVVQKIIELVPRQHLDFIMNALEGQVDQFARHSYGCRVIQRMLENGTEEDRAKIMREIHKKLHDEIIDQYGNYVTQHVIQNGKPEDREKIIQMVISELVFLSGHKFASNVVEKCIEFGSNEQRSKIREILMSVGNDGSTPLQVLIKDQYGNYVIQKLLGQLEDSQRELLVEAIKPHYFNLKKNGTSRQLQALEKLLGVGAALSGKTAAQAGADSSTPTPVLTNEPNSPLSSSPSTSSSAIEAPAGHGVTKPSTTTTGPPRVQVNEE